MSDSDKRLKNNNPSHKLTVREQRAGGKKSAEVRRQKKTLAQLGDMIGELPVMSEEGREILRSAGITEENMINDTLSIWQLNAKANKGDPRAIELLARLRGQLNDKNALNGLQVESVTIHFGSKKRVIEEVK